MQILEKAGIQVHLNTINTLTREVQDAITLIPCQPALRSSLNTNLQVVLDSTLVARELIDKMLQETKNNV